MPYAAINIGMEAVSCAVLMVLALLQFSKKSKTWQDKLFTLVLLACLLQTACDTAAWWLSGRPGAAALYAAHTVNFLLNGTATFAMFFFFLYVYVYVFPNERYSKAQKRPMWVIGALSVLQLVFSVVNLWNGMLYSIDASNHYHWGDWYILQYIVIWAQLLIVMLVIISWRKSLKQKDIWAFLSFVAFPGIVALFTFFESRLMLHYPAMMLSLLLIYATVQKEQEKQLELALQDSRTAMMISQIQPHFLYNALSSIAILCDEKPSEAKKAIISFSEYLRGNMNSLTITQPIPFTKELEHVKHYLTLELRRFRDRLRVTYDIAADSFSLPALTLQPIVENAVRHGIQKQRKGGTVSIATREEADGIVITVADDGVGFDPDTAGDAAADAEHAAAYAERGVGIANVRQRIGAMCGGSLHIESAPGVGTTVTLWIPKQRDGRSKP